MKRIALDLDMTLAGSILTVFEYAAGTNHDYGYGDIESWEWCIETFGSDDFYEGFSQTWDTSPIEVEPMEPGLSRTVGRLHSAYSVDIVTSQPDESSLIEGKKEWLKNEEIPYDEFITVSPNETKADLEYEIFIDDKPELPLQADSADIYLRDHRYNRDAEGEYTRVGSVAEATALILENGSER